MPSAVVSLFWTSCSPVMIFAFSALSLVKRWRLPGGAFCISIRRYSCVETALCLLSKEPKAMVSVHAPVVVQSSAMAEEQPAYMPRSRRTSLSNSSWPPLGGGAGGGWIVVIWVYTFEACVLRTTAGSCSTSVTVAIVKSSVSLGWSMQASVTL